MVEFLMNWQHKIQQTDPPENVFKFSTYQMAILVICYFQLWNYLPSVKFLQSKTERVFCGGKCGSAYVRIRWKRQLINFCFHRRPHRLSQTNSSIEAGLQSSPHIFAGLLRFLRRSLRLTKGCAVGILRQTVETQMLVQRWQWQSGAVQIHWECKSYSVEWTICLSVCTWFVHSKCIAECVRRYHREVDENIPCTLWNLRRISATNAIERRMNVFRLFMVKHTRACTEPRVRTKPNLCLFIILFFVIIWFRWNRARYVYRTTATTTIS